MDYREPKHGIPRELLVWLSPLIISVIGFLVALLMPLWANLSRSCHREPPATPPTQQSAPHVTTRDVPRPP